MHPTIGLAMIVKNEAHVIERCLKSVIPIISSYLIVDTGSTDTTVEAIRALMENTGIPGEVVSRDWLDFGSNRSEALQLAREQEIEPGGPNETRTDYTLMIDADDTLRIDNRSKMLESLSRGIDAYNLRFEDYGHTYVRPQICKTHMPFHYVHPLHEYLVCDVPFTQEEIKGLTYIRIGGGGRHKDPDKTEKEIAIFKNAIEKDPSDARSTFYLAQTYYYAWQVENAIAYYEKVLELPGWTEERFIARLHLGQLEHSKENWPRALHHYLEAYGQNPKRAEPLECIANYYRKKEGPGWPFISYLFARQAAQIVADPKGFLVDESVHEYKALDEYALAAYYSGKYAESVTATMRLLTRKFPEEDLGRIEENLRFAKEGVAYETKNHLQTKAKLRLVRKQKDKSK